MVKEHPQPYFIESKSLGQIGCGKVVPFTPRDKRKWIPLPKDAKAFHQFTEYEVCGDSLSGERIFDGDLLTCRINFELSEIKPHKICIVRVLSTNEELAKKVSISNDGTVTLSSANPNYPPLIFFADEIEILAIVVEARFQL